MYKISRIHCSHVYSFVDFVENTTIWNEEIDDLPGTKIFNTKKDALLVLEKIMQLHDSDYTCHSESNFYKIVQVQT